MIETMGQIIKKLRLEQNFTQEELAEQLNISPQAVSKWENGGSYPDISQILPLASVFGVGVDVLFGTAGVNDDEEVEKIINEIEKPHRGNRTPDDDFDEIAYYKYLEALKRYPNNIRLLSLSLGQGCNLITALKENGENDDKINEIFKECVREAELIINYGKKTEDILYAHLWLVRLYSDFGMFDKAEEHACYFPETPDFTTYNQLAWIARAEKNYPKAVRHYINAFANLLFEISQTLEALGNVYVREEKYEDAISVYNTLPRIIEAVYGDKKSYAPPFHVRAQMPHLAYCYAKTGKPELALDVVEAIYANHITNGESYNKITKIDIPTLRDREFVFYGDEYNAKEMILFDLSSEWLDPIRNTPRFREILKKAENLP